MRRAHLRVRPVATAGLALGAIALAGCGAAAATEGAEAPAAHTIQATTEACAGEATVTASATGTVTAAPDTFTMTLGVQVEAPEASVALAIDDSKAAHLVAVLKGAGVPASGIQTTGLSISPNYKNGGVVGYVANNTVTVTLTKLTGVGAIIDKAAAAVGNGIQLDNVGFSLTNDSQPALKARQEAVTTAEARAQAMASAAGVTLGSLCSLSDASSPLVVGDSGVVGFAAASAPSAGVPTPVESGTEQVTANVTAVYTVSAASSS